jgi:hypothetical protein
MKEQNKTHKPRMAPQKDAPPGLEQDGCGRAIPFDQRTEEDQEKVRSGRKDQAP